MRAESCCRDAAQNDWTENKNGKSFFWTVPLKITFNINYKRWFYAMNLLSKKSIRHTTYKASISKACLYDQILNDHF